MVANPSSEHLIVPNHRAYRENEINRNNEVVIAFSTFVVRIVYAMSSLVCSPASLSRKYREDPCLL